MLGEASTTAIVKTKNPRGFVENKTVAREGGAIAGNARKALEIKTGKKVVSKNNYLPEKRLSDQRSGKNRQLKNGK
jgi:DNA-damage-inducible protein D